MNIVKLTLNFASPEATIANFAETDDSLLAALAAKTTELCDAEIAHDKLCGNAELSIRNAPAGAIKITEGYVTAAIATNDDVCNSKLKIARLRTEVANIKAAIGGLERKHGLFKTWLNGQRPVGLNE